MVGALAGLAVFALFYRQTDGWAENTTRPPQGHYEPVTAKALETWPWTYKDKLVAMTGDVREVIDVPGYIDPLVQPYGGVAQLSKAWNSSWATSWAPM